MIIKLTLLDDRPIWVNMDHMLSATEEMRGAKFVFVSGTSITVKETLKQIDELMSKRSTGV